MPSALLFFARSKRRNNKHSTYEKTTYGAHKVVVWMTSIDKKIAQEYGSSHEKDSNNQQPYVLHGFILFL